MTGGSSSSRRQWLQKTLQADLIERVSELRASELAALDAGLRLVLEL